jgi:hypothetical protein
MRSRARKGITLFESVAALTIVGLVAISALETVVTDSELQTIPDSVASGSFDAPLDEYSWEITSAPVADMPGVYDVALNIVWENGSYPIKTKMYRRPRLIQARAR